MKALILNNRNENLPCTEGILKTFYLMLGGRKNFDGIKGIFIAKDPKKLLNSIQNEIKNSEGLKVHVNRNSNSLPDLSSYFDLIDKAQYDENEFYFSNDIYKLVDCLLSLNALPDWILNSEAPENLKIITQQKVEIMKGINYEFDITKLENDIDAQLRFVRIFCNHIKHAENKEELPKVKVINEDKPLNSVPNESKIMLQVKDKEINPKDVLSKLLKFWIDTTSYKERSEN